MADATRLTAEEIFEGVLTNARAELSRPDVALGLSGLGAGIAMGLTPLAVAAVSVGLGGGARASFLANLVYPLGFVVVVVGRLQLFTENTLFPVTLVLDERRHVTATLRLWAVVFLANVLGAVLFALMAVRSGGLSPALSHELSALGLEHLHHDARSVFASGILAGWIIALVAWLVTAAQRTIGQIVLIWALTFAVGALHLAHCIAGSGSSLSAVVAGNASAAQYVAWLGAATAGNIVGGVVIVALLNFGQVRAGSSAMRKMERRVADTQVHFRRLNQQGGASDAGTVRAYVCECGDARCREQIALTGDEYGQIHANPTRFVILRGHQIPGVESVVEQRDGYAVVEKRGATALYVAEQAGERV